MSKQSNNKPFQSNIEDLFEELDGVVAPQEQGGDTPTSDWVWACDGDGNYASVSEAVSELTGVSAQAFVGQPLLTYRIAPESQAQLGAALASNRFPLQVQVGFLMGDNRYQIVTLHLQGNDSNGKPGVHGFNEALGIEFESAHTPEPPPVEAAAAAPAPIEEEDPIELALRNVAAELAMDLAPINPDPDAAPPIPAASPALPEPAAIVPVEDEEPEALTEYVEDEAEDALLLHSDEDLWARQAARQAEQREELAQHEAAPVDDAAIVPEDGAAFKPEMATAQDTAEPAKQAAPPDLLDAQPESSASEEPLLPAAPPRSEAHVQEADPTADEPEQQAATAETEALGAMPAAQEDEPALLSAEEAPVSATSGFDTDSLQLSEQQLSGEDEPAEAMVAAVDEDEDGADDAPQTDSLSDDTQPEVRTIQERVREQRRRIDTTPLEGLRDQLIPHRERELTRPREAEVSSANNSLMAKLNLPMGSGAVLEILGEDPNRQWTEDERILVAQVADQLELALENADLFQQTQTALSETDALYQASAELNAANSYDDVLNILRKYTIVGQNCTLLAINLFDQPWGEVPPKWFDVLDVWDPVEQGKWQQRTRIISLPALGRMLRRNTATFVNEVARDTRLDDATRTFFQESFDAQSALFIPMVSGSDWVGFINAFFNREMPFNDPQRRRLNSIATQAIEKITSLRLTQMTAARRANADALNEVARQFGEILSLDELRGRLMFEVSKRVKPDDAILYSWRNQQRLFVVDDVVRADPLTSTDLTVGDQVAAEQRPDLLSVFQSNQVKYEALDWHDGQMREQFIAPWSIGDALQGVIEVRHTGRKLVITELEQEFLNGLLLQAASSMERARLFEQTQSALALTDEQARRLEVLNQLSNDLSAAQTLEDVYRLSIGRVHQIFPDERLSMTLIDETGQNVEVVEVHEIEGAPSRLLKGQLIPLEGTANQTAIEEQRVLMENNDPTSAVRSYMIGPLVAGGAVLGTLNIGSQQPNFFKDQDSNFMAQLSAVISSAIENRQLFHAIQDSLSTSEEQARRLAELNAMSESLASATSLNDVLQIAARRLSAIVPFEYAAFAQLNEDGHSLTVLEIDQDGRVQTEFSNYPLAGTLAAEVIAENHQRTLNSADAFTHPDTRLMAERGLRSMMYVPIQAGSQVIGTLNLGQRTPNAYSLRDQSLMTSVGSFLSSTIDNRELLSQIQRRSSQLEATAEVSRVTSQILDSTELLPRVVNLIQEGFGLYYCGLFMVDDDGRWTDEPGKWAVLQAGTGEAGQAMLANGHKLEIGGNSMIGNAIASKQARIALDVGAEAVFFRNPNLPETRSEMALPLISRGEVLGALTIQSTEEAAFSAEDITALQTLADQVANTIQNAQLFEETEERAEELAVLNDMARAFTQIVDEATVIESTYEVTSRLMNANNFYLALFDPTTDMIDFKLFTQSGQRIPPPEPRIKRGDGITDWIITHRQPVLLQDNVTKQMQDMGLELRGEVSKSYLGVPLLRGDQVLGVIAVQSYEQPRVYGPRERDLLTAIASQVSIAIENARLFLTTQTRARREQLLREITARVHSSADPEIILKTAVREVSQALGRKAFIELQREEDNAPQPPAAPTPRVIPPNRGEDNGNATGDEQP